MKKDIQLRQVQNIIFAVIPRSISESDTFWDVYLINLQDKPITNAIVSSKGFGEIDGKQVETSTLRHFFEKIPGVSYQLIEPIQPKVTHIHNQYWLSFKQEDYLYDKKYTFVQGSIEEANMTEIPLIGKMGVMIG